VIRTRLKASSIAYRDWNGRPWRAAVIVSRRKVRHMTTKLHSAIIRVEEDVIAACRRTREIAALLGFTRNDQTRIAAAVSEIARNTLTYAGCGSAEYSVDSDPPVFRIRLADEGPGIPELKKVLKRAYKSRTGAGPGIGGARSLMDTFSIESEPGKGTVVTLGKTIPNGGQHLTPQRLAKIPSELAKPAARNLLDELRQENQQWLQIAEELRERDENLARLKAELEDINRGVVALYAELEENAGRLRRADQMKSRFLSHMSHEFRTPLTSIMALSRLLVDESDGKLSIEQHKQVNFIRKSAESLLEMVNDLLDLVRVETGRSVVRPAPFPVANLFGALRGLMRPLQVNRNVELIFEDAPDLPPLHTDQSKVAQILRNFLSNSLKFTERGEVRVSARLSEDGKSAVFSVSDTGIGIAPENHELIFQEFGRLDMPAQMKFKGTGLGLPLAKGLAELLGGSVQVQSAPGRGSVFTAEIPLMYQGGDLQQPVSGGNGDILLIDDEEVSRYLVRKALGSSVNAVEASDVAEGIELARKHRPRIILLDVGMPGRNGFQLLKELKSDPVTREIPVIALTATSLTPDELEILNSQTAAVLSKEVLSQTGGGQRLREAIAETGHAQ
jgi:signal transduction histidine kinase